MLLLPFIAFTFFVNAQKVEKYKWQRVLEGGGGATCQMWFHPQVPDEMIISGDVGGPWHWNRETKKWDYLTDFSALLEDNCFAQIVYDWSDSTGNTFLMHNGGFGTISNGRQNHFYLTHDGGKTFQMGNYHITGKHGNFKMELMKGDPYNSKIIYYAGIYGIDVSFDQGMNFESLQNQPEHTVSKSYYDKELKTGSEMVWIDAKAGFVTDIINGNTILHARRIIVTQITPPNDVQKSFVTNDGCKTWQELPVTLTRIRQGLESGVILASGPGNFFKSYDGFNWKNTNSPVNGGLCDVNPFNNAHMIVTGYMKDFAVSVDTGKTWTSVKSRCKMESESKFYSTANLFDGVEDIEFDPHFKNRIWMGNWFFWAYTDSCFKTNDVLNDKVQWYTRIKGYEEMSTCGIGGVSAPNADAMVHFTVGDNGGIRITDLERFPEARDVTRGTMGNHVGIDYCGSDNDFMVCTSMSHWWDPGWGYYSTNNGQNWSAFKANPKEDIFEDGNLNNSTGNIAVSASKNHGGWPAIVRGNINPYYSHDGGLTWKKSLCDGYYIIWSWISETVNVLISDKVTPDKFYYLGFPPNIWSKKNLYVSTDGGVTFPLVKSNLPNASKIAVNPWVDGDLWIGENGTGLMHSKDGGLTWSAIPKISNTVAFGLGKGNKPDSVSVYVLGSLDGVRGVYRSDNQGVSWVNIGDPANGYGMMDYRIIGDNKVWGRMYLAMTSTGAFFAEPAEITCLAAENLNAHAGNAKVLLTWNSSTGVRTNYLLRSVSETGPFEMIDSISGVSYVDRNVVNETSYYYKIRAVGYTNNTEPIGPVIATPSALLPPESVRGLLVFSKYDNTLKRNTIKISWSRNSTDEKVVSYSVKRKTINTDFEEIASTSNSIASYTDTIVTNGETYFYTIAANNLNGQSSLSGIVQITYFDVISSISNPHIFRMAGNEVQFEKPQDFEVYDIMGIKVGNYKNTDFFNFGNLNNGIYIIRFADGGTHKFIKD